MAPLPLLRRLREETRPEHESIEQVVPLMDDRLTRPAYARYLVRTLGFYRPVEAALRAFQGWSDLGLDFAVRAKVPRLEADLRALAMSCSEVAECAALPRIDSAPAALGCLYVLEGSTLGAQLLLRQVERRLGLTPQHGASFLAGYGRLTRERWSEVQRCLGAYAERGGPAEPLVETARATFRCLEAWLRAGELHAG